MKKLIFISILMFSAFTMQAEAAEVFVSSPGSVFTRDSFSIDIYADTDGALINSVDLLLDYPEDLITFSGYKSEGGAVRLWVESPHELNGEISMQGIIPGGVLGIYDPKDGNIKPVPLVRLLFQAKNPGEVKFNIKDSTLLLHDGEGSTLSHDVRGALMKVIYKEPGKDEENEITKGDKLPPEQFEVTFLESSFFSRTPSMVLFQAIDLDSGIEKYEIKVGIRDWQQSNSPYVIRKGLLAQSVSVRAYDFAGNYTDSSVVIPGLISYTLLFVLLGIIFCGILGFKLLKYRL